MNPENPECPCQICNPNAWWMVACPTCGNKRCPHATHHDNRCTNSNEPGQVGELAVSQPLQTNNEIFDATFTPETFRNLINDDFCECLNEFQRQNILRHFDHVLDAMQRAKSGHEGSETPRTDEALCGNPAGLNDRLYRRSCELEIELAGVVRERNLQKHPNQFSIKLQARDGQHHNFFAYGEFERVLQQARLVHKIDFGNQACILVFEELEETPSQHPAG